MKLSDVKFALLDLQELRFQLPDGSFVPAHFHVTEVGQNTRSFIDCGGTVRRERKVNFQLWQADDFDHRLAPAKLMDIINLSVQVLGIEDDEVEVEYQGDTIGKYNLEFDGQYFQLKATQTDCLAPDKCGIPQEKPRIRLSSLGSASGSSCAPGSGCC